MSAEKIFMIFDEATADNLVFDYNVNKIDEKHHLVKLEYVGAKDTFLLGATDGKRIIILSNEVSESIFHNIDKPAKMLVLENIIINLVNCQNTRYLQY